ncbi:uncharacterized protein LOC109815628 [Cajanus cajan]|uniref:uncharacterized protein LOC109815628 n=1 Tax=Cajanus cajan TaxID=3821 RepID=UPI00098DB778|nr:uncharacterized protein LOC109815628 [Cajanus cajan]
MDPDKTWNIIWSLPIPAKVKHHTWRVYKNILPTRAQLQKKGVSCPISCPRCDVGIENSWHALFGCYDARICWLASNLKDKMSSNIDQANGTSDLVNKILNLWSNSDAADFCMMMWSIWTSRNNLLWKDMPWNTSEVVHRARNSRQNWTLANQRPLDVRGILGPTSTTQWSPPPHGSYKCNFATFPNSDENTFGIGFCIRDSLGSFVGARTLKIPGLPPASIRDAIALMQAIILASENQYSPILFESSFDEIFEVGKGSSLNLRRAQFFASGMI